jgi:hypothetical protein
VIVSASEPGQRLDHDERPNTGIEAAADSAIASATASDHPPAAVGSGRLFEGTT